MEDSDNQLHDPNEKHRYYANAIGVIAVCILLMFLAHTCQLLSPTENELKKIELLNKK